MIKRLRQFIFRSWGRLLLGSLALLLISPFLLIYFLGWMMDQMEKPLERVERQTLSQPDGQPLNVFRHSVPGATTTVIFVHGTPGDARSFSHQFKNGFPHATLVAYDRPGFGGSPGDNTAATLDYQCRTLEALIESTDTPRIFLVGHSYGCPVALNTALRNPSRIAGVFLMGACLGPEFEKPLPIQYWLRGAWWAGLLPDEIQQSNEELLNLKADLDAMLHLLPKLNCPLLLLHGTKDEQVPVENVEAIQLRLEAVGKKDFFAARVYPGWNHFLPWGQAETVNAELTKFIAP